MPWSWNTQDLRQHPQMGRWYVRMERQPRWVVRTALFAAMLVVVVPIVALTLAALLVAMVVVAVGSLIAGVVRLFAGSITEPTLRDHDGRENVRVIHRP